MQRKSWAAAAKGSALILKRQKRSGRRKGYGSRKGKANARAADKLAWKNQIRSQRALLKIMKEKGNITKKVYRGLYEKAKGGFFRSRKHLKLYIEERNLAKE